MSTGCQLGPVLAGSALLIGLGALVLGARRPSPYGRHLQAGSRARLPARAAWFLQELPSFALPAGILVHRPLRQPNALLLALFCAHYFHRTFIYSMQTRGKPVPVSILLWACAFCVGNGTLQAYSLSYCADYPAEWCMDPRFILGILLFVAGMAVNIHSDHILCQLRKPGEVIYQIPRGSTIRYLRTIPNPGKLSSPSSFEEKKVK
ncbi:3-oxo-5-alpha-steroid 4-dehydrogenase 2 isoform X2 [Erinaceus europaeus]|uniref:3-oxo-5-alpha-steroid 4-dehydrogenase 2 isoform X2 n=1 Tax=Erinaceus europaeus TaxID=9365 RepID=A0ABM3X1V9_ERIEU|nr:3-oxo-5-alpha-steroid 4-dehydrogenase 2 isoform X2 [Erinaceus europaeus]